MRLVSIVLPTYNGEEFLKHSIESVISQTYPNWELIIVNDYSSDSTPQIAEWYAKKDKRIKVIHNECNKKISASLNAGFNVAKGEYFTWTSDDNYYMDTAIERMVEHLELTPDDVMVHSAFTCFNLIKKEKSITRTKTTVESILRGCTCGPCFLYRCSAAKAIGEYDITLRFAQDWDYWLRMFLHGNIGYIDESMYVYRLHEKCLTVKCKKELYKDDELLKNKYRELYAEKYLFIKKVFVLEFEVDEYRDSGNKEILKRLESKYPAKRLYKEYKRRYIMYQNSMWLKAIYRLGVLYVMKALLLKRKKDGAL